MKTSKIKFIDNDGEWNGMKKFKVFFADDSKYTFFSKSDTFSKQVGDELKYEPKINPETGEESGTASIVRDSPAGGFKSFSQKNTPDISRKIERQTVIKAVGQRFSAAKLNIKAELDWANEMYKWINEN